MVGFRFRVQTGILDSQTVSRGHLVIYQFWTWGPFFGVSGLELEADCLFSLLSRFKMRHCLSPWPPFSFRMWYLHAVTFLIFPLTAVFVSKRVYGITFRCLNFDSAVGCFILDCDIVYSCWRSPIFRRNIFRITFLRELVTAYKTTWRHNPEHRNPHFHCRKNLRSHFLKLAFLIQNDEK